MCAPWLLEFTIDTAMFGRDENKKKREVKYRYAKNFKKREIFFYVV